MASSETGFFGFGEEVFIGLGLGYIVVTCDLSVISLFPFGYLSVGLSKYLELIAFICPFFGWHLSGICITITPR